MHELDFLPQGKDHAAQDAYKGIQKMKHLHSSCKRIVNLLWQQQAADGAMYMPDNTNKEPDCEISKQPAAHNQRAHSADDSSLRTQSGHADASWAMP